MAESITIELPDDETRKGMDAAMQPYRKQITETPALLSVLYDIDLLPEQIRLPVNVRRMIAFCELWRRLTLSKLPSYSADSAQPPLTTD